MGLPDELPAITGLVLTSVKENELVEVPIVSPLPTGQLNPVLAHWTYGLGRSRRLHLRRRPRVGQPWPDWDSYAAFWSQVVRWSMRPVEQGNLTLTLRREDGQDQGRRRRARQGRPVPELPPAPGERQSTRTSNASPTLELAQSAPGRTRGRSRTPRPGGTTSSTSATRRRRRTGRDLHRRLGPLLRRVSRAALESRDAAKRCRA